MQTLSTTFEITINSDKVKSIELEFAVTTKNTEWQAATGAGATQLIAAEPTFSSTGDGYTLADKKITINDYEQISEHKITVTVTFAWGTKYSAQDPVDYYSILPYSDSNVKAAKDDLEKINALDGAQFTITATAKTTV